MVNFSSYSQRRGSSNGSSSFYRSSYAPSEMSNTPNKSFTSRSIASSQKNNNNNQQQQQQKFGTPLYESIESEDIELAEKGAAKEEVAVDTEKKELEGDVGSNGIDDYPVATFDDLLDNIPPGASDLR